MQLTKQESSKPFKGFQSNVYTFETGSRDRSFPSLLMFDLLEDVIKGLHHQPIRLLAGMTPEAVYAHPTKPNEAE